MLSSTSNGLQKQSFLLLCVERGSCFCKVYVPYFGDGAWSVSIFSSVLVWQGTVLLWSSTVLQSRSSVLLQELIVVIKFGVTKTSQITAWAWYVENTVVKNHFLIWHQPLLCQVMVLRKACPGMSYICCRNGQLLMRSWFLQPYPGAWGCFVSLNQPETLHRQEIGVLWSASMEKEDLASRGWTVPWRAHAVILLYLEFPGDLCAEIFNY